MTFRRLLEALQQFAVENPDHEALDQQVVVRVGVPNGDDDEDIHVGGLQSAVVDAGCTDKFALVIDADQEPDEDEVPSSEGSTMRPLARVVVPGPGHDSVAEAVEIAASHVLYGLVGQLSAGQLELPLSHEQHIEACTEIGRLSVRQLALEHGCPVHAGAVHGGEAQALRLGIEAILDRPYDDSLDPPLLQVQCRQDRIKQDLQKLLDRVDAADSLAHMER